MTIDKTVNGTELTMALEGRLDTATAPQLEGELNSLGGMTSLVIDMAKLIYISSAGLRVLLKAQKTMAKQGSMVIRHVSQDIRDIFEVTGFDEILTIEG